MDSSFPHSSAHVSLGPWATKFGAIMKEEGWEISKADPKVWMKRDGDHYEYVGSHVDDLIVAATDPQAFFDCLREKYELRLKGDAPLRYHLGCNFGRDPDGTLCQSAKQYVERMHDNYTRLFKSSPRSHTTPLEPNDHPELDLSPELDEDGIARYQSLIGSLQWAVSLQLMQFVCERNCHFTCC